MSKRILVVEDQPDNRQIIRDMLAPTDYVTPRLLDRRAPPSPRGISEAGEELPHLWIRSGLPHRSKQFRYLITSSTRCESYRELEAGAVRVSFDAVRIISSLAAR